jgi:hypothetical protein
VYISPDSRLGDKVAIGMFMLYGNKLTLRYSDQKLHSLKSVLGTYWDAIAKSLRATQKYIENINLSSKPIFHEARYMVSPDYLLKLSIYANGLIQYQEPKLAILTPEFGLDEFYNSLFPEEYKVTEKVKKPNYGRQIDQNFISKVKEQVHVNIDIDDSVIPEFYTKYSLDAIGRNGVLYLANYLDFTNENKAPISHFLVTVDNLTRIYNSTKTSKVFIFGVEPELGSESHKNWAFINKCDGYKIYHPDQADVVADIFLNSGAGKFLGL